MTTTTIELRQNEKEKFLQVALEKQSFLVVADAGSGKTTMANLVKDELINHGLNVAIADYAGDAKSTLQNISDQLAIDTFKMVPREKSDDKEVALTATEMKAAIAEVLKTSNSILICDNAHRYPTALRYWLEEIVKGGGTILMFATHPPRAGIFLIMPRIEMKSLETNDVRSLMLEEANVLGVKVEISKLAELQERSGGNPYLAKRAIREEALGLGEGEAGDHVEYIDGTPFLIAGISLVAIVRFIGLGLGDKGLYMIGGIATVLAITIRVFFQYMNRRSSRL